MEILPRPIDCPAIVNDHDRGLAVRSIVSLYREFEQVARRSNISLGQYRTLLYLRAGPKNAGAIAAAGEINRLRRLTRTGDQHTGSH